MDKKQYWENVYRSKQFTEVSWYQQVPHQSLDFLKQLAVSKNATIIDIGGGDSYFVDHLLQQGYQNITVLDISAMAIEKAKLRLGARAAKINWIVSDVTQLNTDMKFDYWHDRATFHFLTEKKDVNNYLSVARKHLSKNGRLMIGTFSIDGPDKCSGLPVKQYDEISLQKILQKWFAKIRCIASEHITPFNTIQHFLFCSFQKITT